MAGSRPRYGSATPMCRLLSLEDGWATLPATRCPLGAPWCRPGQGTANASPTRSCARPWQLTVAFNSCGALDTISFGAGLRSGSSCQLSLGAPV